MTNPFTLEFGAQPPEYIDRFTEMTEIFEDFASPNPSSHTYALLGPRGCGKTVLLNDISERIANKKDWISVTLNCKSDLLLQLAASINENIKTDFLDIKPEFSFSFSFMSLTLKGKDHVSDIHVLLQKMFEIINRHNKKVLVAIDDVSVNEHMEIFAKEFQLLRGKLMPIFLVMTGLYSTFNKFQSTDGLTFLLRAPKIYLGPLNERAIAKTYEETLKISLEKAKELASFTKGYAFCYQCLGYLLIKYGKRELDEQILSKLDYYLEEGVYLKLREELSLKEKEILKFLTTRDEVSNQELIESSIVDKNTISTYKGILNRKGVINLSTRGKLCIALPRLKEFITYYFE